VRSSMRSSQEMLVDPVAPRTPCWPALPCHDFDRGGFRSSSSRDTRAQSLHGVFIRAMVIHGDLRQCNSQRVSVRDVVGLSLVLLGHAASFSETVSRGSCDPQQGAGVPLTPADYSAYTSAYTT